MKSNFLFILLLKYLNLRTQMTKYENSILVFFLLILLFKIVERKSYCKNDQFMVK